MYKRDGVKREIKLQATPWALTSSESFILGPARVPAHSDGERIAGRRMYKSSSNKTARAQGEGIQGRLRMHKVPMRGRVNSMKEHQSVGYAVLTERLKYPTTRKVCSGEHRQDLMMST
jgi:hypothetical protein